MKDYRDAERESFAALKKERDEKMKDPKIWEVIDRTASELTKYNKKISIYDFHTPVLEMEVKENDNF